MLTTTRRVTDVVPQGLYRALLPAATLSAFVWLLASDAIAPLAIYALQLFLSF